MTVKELISELSKLSEEDQNLPVYQPDEVNIWRVEEVRVETQSWSKSLPTRYVLIN